MNRKKYPELRRKRLEDREERFKKERERIEKQRAALKRRKRAKEEKRRRTEPEGYEKEKMELEKRKKARESITSVKATVEEIEKKTNASLFTQKMTQKINEKLSKAEQMFESGDREKAIELSPETNEPVGGTGLEACRKALTEEKMRIEKAKYFYCIIPFSKIKSFGNIGINNSEVYTIPYKDVAGVVSDSPMKDYELSEDNVRRHGEVLSQVMKEHTIVPVEFGTTIKNEKILRSLIEQVYNQTMQCLRLVDNKVELGVKAVSNEDLVFISQMRKEFVSDILASLGTITKQAVKGDLFSDKLILNASFLIDKKDVDAFSEKVAELQDKYPKLKLLYSGPWAPYNFVYIKIGAKGLEVTKKR